ncbi:MAG: sensor histidine kinase, partial [Desulfonatronovibrio sp.]
NHIIKNNNDHPHRWEHYNPERGKHYYITNKLIKWPDGRDVRFELAIDITRRKQAEEKISRVNKELERANAEKDKFFSIIGHDLKSPMSGVLSSSELLASNVTMFSQEDIVFISSEMHKSAKNVLALLNDLLQWSRMSQGLMDYDPESSDLNDLAMASINTAKDVAGKKNINISCDIPSGLNILVDQPMINTVIRNLIFNAVKFTHSGGNISLTAREQGDMVEVCVQDDGIGMDEKVRSAVFSTDKSKRQIGTEGEIGTGLGLVLCKKFIEKHGGRVWLESEAGKGTKVYFTLPAQEGICRL